jgi:hypothetical protein
VQLPPPPSSTGSGPCGAARAGARAIGDVPTVAGAGSATQPAASPPGRDALVAQLRELLERRGSPMASSVEALVDAAHRHGIDPRIMVAIAGQESEFGTTNPQSLRNNPFGFLWNGDLNSPFESWEAGYERVAGRLAEMIHEQGFTSVYALGEGDPNVRDDGYCEVGARNDPTGLNSGWIGGVSAMYRELGGDPNDLRA